MSKVRITSYANSSSQKEDDVKNYINELSNTVSEQLTKEFPDKDELKIAQITLNVCSKLLEAHFLEKARLGKLPTD